MDEILRRDHSTESRATEHLISDTLYFAAQGGSSLPVWMKSWSVIGLNETEYV